MDSKTLEIAQACVNYIAENDKQGFGVGVNQIVSAFTRNQTNQISYSDVFTALCSSFQSTRVFKLSNSDQNDYYFQLKMPHDKALEYLSSFQVIEPTNIEDVRIDQSRVLTPQFDKLMDDMRNVARGYNALLQKNEDLIRTQNEVQIQVLALSNQAMMRQQLTNCNELIKRLSTDMQ